MIVPIKPDVKPNVPGPLTTTGHVTDRFSAYDGPPICSLLNPVVSPLAVCQSEHGLRVLWSVCTVHVCFGDSYVGIRVGVQCAPDVRRVINDCAGESDGCPEVLV